MKTTQKILSSLIALAFIFFASIAPTHAAERITIAAASDLRFALDEVIARFTQLHHEAQVDVIYGSSGKIQAQIQQGAPYDLFFSADISYPRLLKENGFAASEITPYALGKIVLWTKLPPPEKRDAKSLKLANLADPAIKKIAIANPQHAPYGKRSEQALKASGLWERIEPKLIYGEDIAQTAQYAASGNADVGIIALSLALNAEMSKMGAYSLIPENLYEPLEQAFIITQRGASNVLAKEFANYMLSNEARSVMMRFGFSLPRDATAKK